MLAKLLRQIDPGIPARYYQCISIKLHSDILNSLPRVPLRSAAASPLSPTAGRQLVCSAGRGRRCCTLCTPPGRATVAHHPVITATLGENCIPSVAGGSFWWKCYSHNTGYCKTSIQDFWFPQYNIKKTLQDFKHNLFKYHFLIPII